jgi:hypothetical protein
MPNIITIGSGTGNIITISPSVNAQNVVVSPYAASLGGSISFGTMLNSYVAFAASSDWAPGTGDFTWEWYQYQTTGSLSGRWQFPRVFECGEYQGLGGGIKMGVTIESNPNIMYVWGGTQVIMMSRTLTGNPQVGAWTHFAVTRNGTNLRLFMNGTQQGATVTDSTNISDATRPLFIGMESGSYATQTEFPGFITNLHLVKGTALYTGNFIRPSMPLTSVANTKLLLLATTSASCAVDTAQNLPVTFSNIAWSSTTPYS